MPSSQRPFFLSSFLAAFRQPSPQTTTSTLSASSQSNKHHGHHPSNSAGQSNSHSTSTAASTAERDPSSTGGVMNQLPGYSQRSGSHGHGHSQGASVPIPGGGRRRGSDSSSEGFRDVLGADKFYIGGRTAGGDEKFFKLGVVKRVRSQDRLSLDRLSL